MTLYVSVYLRLYEKCIILIYVVYMGNYCDREKSIDLEILTDLQVFNASPPPPNVKKCCFLFF
jgi:hypothetical protein